MAPVGADQRATLQRERRTHGALVGAFQLGHPKNVGLP